MPVNDCPQQVSCSCEAVTLSLELCGWSLEYPRRKLLSGPESEKAFGVAPPLFVIVPLFPWLWFLSQPPLLACPLHPWQGRHFSSKGPSLGSNPSPIVIYLQFGTSYITSVGVILLIYKAGPITTTTTTIILLPRVCF